LLLIGPVNLENRMAGQNYLELLQNELPEQLEDVPLATRIAMYFQHDGTEPLLILPDLRCNNSMTLFLIDGSVVAGSTIN
jgi:hypothetical protein